MPDDIRRLVKEILHKPVTVQIGRTLPANTVSHYLYPVAERLKMPLLEEILRRTDTESVLIFTRTKIRAEQVTMQLQRSGFLATSLQGNMTQSQRQVSINSFRSGTYKIMVATDIAARGLDILSISHVINYDMPDDTDSYIHRIGRTGRVDQTGQAITLVTGKDEDIVRHLERLLDTKLERRTLPDFEYTVSPASTRKPPFPNRHRNQPAQFHRHAAIQA